MKYYLFLSLSLTLFSFPAFSDCAEGAHSAYSVKLSNRDIEHEIDVVCVDDSIQFDVSGGLSPSAMSVKRPFDIDCNHLSDVRRFRRWLYWGNWFGFTKIRPTSTQKKYLVDALEYEMKVCRGWMFGPILY